MTNLLRKQTSHRRVERLIREGVGVRETTWQLPRAGDAQASRQVVDDVLTWVRGAMGEMRRPYGIDHVAVALACRDEAGQVLCSNSLGVVRPASFYGPEGAASIATFFGDAAHASGGREAEVVGAILSLGDIAYELGSARTA